MTIRKIAHLIDRHKLNTIKIQKTKGANGYDKEPEPIIPSWEQKKKTKVRSFDLHPDIPMSERNTFDLVSNPVETVGKKERFRRNIMAIQLLKKCQEENRFASPDEQLILSKYVGWGGIPEAFDDRNSAWATEYLELSTVLTPEEYAAARESTLTAFYTPPEVSTAIYKVFEQMGFKEGNLLEPSCGIGNFIGMITDCDDCLADRKQCHFSNITCCNANRIEDFLRIKVRNTGKIIGSKRFVNIQS